MLCSPSGVGVPFTWALLPALEGRGFLDNTHVRSHLYLLPGYVVTSISPSYRKAAQVLDSKASSLPLSPSFKVRGGADPEIEMTAQLLCFIGDIDVRKTALKMGCGCIFRKKKISLCSREGKVLISLKALVSLTHSISLQGLRRSTLGF